MFMKQETVLRNCHACDLTASEPGTWKRDLIRANEASVNGVVSFKLLAL